MTQQLTEKAKDSLQRKAESSKDIYRPIPVTPETKEFAKEMGMKYNVLIQKLDVFMDMVNKKK